MHQSYDGRRLRENVVGLDLAEIRKLIDGERRDRTVVELQHDHIAEHFVVGLATEVQAMTATFDTVDRAGRRRGPDLQAHLDLVGNLDPIARLQTINDVARRVVRMIREFRAGHESIRSCEVTRMHAEASSGATLTNTLSMPLIYRFRSFAGRGV